MSVYKISFGFGGFVYRRANTPKEAWQNAVKEFALEVSHIKFMR